MKIQIEGDPKEIKKLLKAIGGSDKQPVVIDPITTKPIKD